MKQLTTNNYFETIEIGNKIGSLLKSGDVLLLSGDLGAGKTTLIKKLINECFKNGLLFINKYINI